MENLSLSFGVVMPLLLLMLVGFILRKARIVDEASLLKMNQLVFWVGVPALCFKNLYESDLSCLNDAPLLLVIALGGGAVFVILMLVVPLFCTQPARRGVLIQGMFRSNVAIYGLPVAAALLGQEHLTLMTMAIAVVVPIYNLLSVVALEANRPVKHGFKGALGKIVTNPIIIGCVLGLAVNLSGLALPKFLYSPIQSLSVMCTPLAFLVLGASLRFSSMRANRVPLAAAAFVKLAAVPALLIGAALLLGYRGESIAVMMTVFASPTAMASYPMACGMDGDRELAGEIVAVTSGLSMLTIFLFIFLLKQTGVM